MSKNLIILTFTAIVLMLVQVLILKSFVIFGVGFCFLYLMFLLILPLETGFATAMILGLLAGLTVDLFYNTLGIHAFACVLVMFLRPYWMKFNKPRSGYEINDLPMISNYGLGWFVIYAFPLIFIHALTVFLIEAAGSQLTGLSILKSIATSLISLVFIIAIQYLFYSKAKR
ncbi:rod shape-determining protein MreD [Roseivirga echinicomitans]